MTLRKTPRASRPVFVPGPAHERVRSLTVEFDWFPGFALEQQRRSIVSFHNSITVQGIAGAPLEISTRSPEELGRSLSAFNLLVSHPIFGEVPLESAFQSSKVFAGGGPYLELAREEPRSAKRDPRIQQSGPLQAFHFGDTTFPLIPSTAFYDWLYIKALSLLDPSLLEQLAQRDGFTDIAFNPSKSLNCQARSAALFASLAHDGPTRPWELDFPSYLEVASYRPQPTSPQGQQTFDFSHSTSPRP